MNEENKIVETKTLIEHVCYRPGLYTINSKLEEVYSFINGIKHSKTSDEEKEQAKIAIGWFHNQMNGYSMDLIRETYKSDEEAILALQKKLKEKS